MKSGPNLSKACLSRMLDLGEFFLNFLEKTGKKINSLRLYRKKMKNIKKILLSGFTSLVLKKRNPVDFMLRGSYIKVYCDYLRP